MSFVRVVIIESLYFFFTTQVIVPDTVSVGVDIIFTLQVPFLLSTNTAVPSTPDILHSYTISPVYPFIPDKL